MHHAAGSSKKIPPFGALDGIWKLLQNSTQVLDNHPRIAAWVLRLLCAMWECQSGPAGPAAADLLRSQTGFWDSLKPFVPVAQSSMAQGGVSSLLPSQDPNQLEAAAYKMQAQASCLHLLLLELLTVRTTIATNPTPAAAPQISSNAAAGSSSPAGDAAGAVVPVSTSTTSSSSSPAPLLAMLGRKELLQLLLGLAAAGPSPWQQELTLPLLQEFIDMLQAAYLQLCSVAIPTSWWEQGQGQAGGYQMQQCLLSCAQELRAEVGESISTVGRAAGFFGPAGGIDRDAVHLACQMLAEGEGGGGVGGEGGEEMEDGMEEDGEGQAVKLAAAALVKCLKKEPLGQVLMSYAAVTPWSWLYTEAEYGR